MKNKLMYAHFCLLCSFFFPSKLYGHVQGKIKQKNSLYEEIHVHEQCSNRTKQEKNPDQWVCKSRYLGMPKGQKLSGPRDRGFLWVLQHPNFLDGGAGIY